MALEDMLGLPPPEPTQASDPLVPSAPPPEINPEFTATRMARKGLVGASDVTDPLASTEQLTLRAREMIDARDRRRQNPEAPPPKGAESFGPALNDAAGSQESFGPAIEPPATPASPQQEGGGSSASPKLGVMDYLKEADIGAGRGIANTIAGGLRGIGQYAQTAGPMFNIPLPGGTDPAEVAKMRAANPAANPLTIAGDALQEHAQKTMAPDPRFTQGGAPQLFSDVAQGAGSVAGGLALGWLSPYLAAGTFVGAGMSEASDRAKQAGASPEDQRLAAKFGSIAGGTDMADMLLFNLGTTGRAVGLLKKVGVAAVAAAMEGGQEGFQQFLQNAIAKGIYNPNQDLSQDVAYNALVGGIVGAGANAAMSSAKGPEAPAAQNPPGTPPGTPPGGGPGPGPGALPPPAKPPGRPQIEGPPEGQPGPQEGPTAGPEGQPPKTPTSAPEKPPESMPPLDAREVDATLRAYKYQYATQDPTERHDAAAMLRIGFPNGEGIPEGGITQEALHAAVLKRFGMPDDMLGVMSAETKRHTAALMTRSLFEPGESTAGGDKLKPIKPDTSGHTPQPGEGESTAGPKPITKVTPESPAYTTAINLLEGKTHFSISQLKREAKIQHREAARIVQRLQKEGRLGEMDEKGRFPIITTGAGNEEQKPLPGAGEGTAGPAPGTRGKPITPEGPADILKAGEGVKEGTPAQQDAENHQSAHVALPELGLTGHNTVTITVPVGGTRKWAANDTGPAGEVTNYPYAYGSAKGVPGADGMNLDVAIGPGDKNSPSFVIDQKDPKTGKFDEHKLFARWPTPEAALAAYKAAYDDPDGKRIMGISKVTQDDIFGVKWHAGKPFGKPAGEQPLKPTNVTLGDEPKKPKTLTADEGEDLIDSILGEDQPKGESTAGPSAPRGPVSTTEQPKTTPETPKTTPVLLPDHPSAEPLGDVEAQIKDLKAGQAHRKGVYLPKPTLEHLEKMKFDLDEVAPTPHLGDMPKNQLPPGVGHATIMVWPKGLVRLPNFDHKGGAVIFANKDDAKSYGLVPKKDLQKLLGELTGDGEGKPADGTHVVQQRDMGDHVTRERLVTAADVDKTKEEFKKGGRTVHVLTPEEVQKRRADLIANELKPGSASEPLEPIAEEEDTSTAGPEVRGEPEPEPEPGHARDYIHEVYEALKAAQVDMRKVMGADIQYAAELMADGTYKDPMQAFMIAVAVNGVHSGASTLEDIKHGFIPEIVAEIESLLGLDEKRPSVPRGATSTEGPDVRPELPGETKDSEPPRGGEAVQPEDEGRGEGEVKPAEEPKAVETEEPKAAPAEEPSTGGVTTEGPAEPRGGVAEQERPQPPHGEPGSPTDTSTAGGGTIKRTGGNETPHGDAESPVAPESPRGSGERPEPEGPTETPSDENAKGLDYFKERAKYYTKLAEDTRQFHFLAFEQKGVRLKDDLTPVVKLEAEIERDKELAKTYQLTQKSGADDDAHPEQGRPYTGAIDQAESLLAGLINRLESHPKSKAALDAARTAYKVWPIKEGEEPKKLTADEGEDLIDNILGEDEGTAGPSAPRGKPWFEGPVEEPPLPEVETPKPEEPKAEEPKPEVKDEGTQGGGNIKSGGGTAVAEAEPEKPALVRSGPQLRNARKYKRRGGLTDEDIDEMNPAERNTHITKEKVWNRPDYADLVANGMEPMAAALIKRIYDKIPDKPPYNQSWNGWTDEQAQEAYIKAVRFIRNAVIVVKTVKDVADLGPQGEEWKDVTEGTSTLFAANKPSKYWSNPLQIYGKDRRKAEELVEQGFPNIEAWARVFKIEKRSEWIKTPEGKDKVEDNYVVIKRSSGFAYAGQIRHEETAIERAKELYEEEKKKEGEGPKVILRPHLDTLRRTGPTVREIDKKTGEPKDVWDTDSFVKEFNFLTADYGNSVPPGERQIMLNWAWDSMYDIAHLTGLSIKSIGLDGILKFALGANGLGGKGAAAAHYESDDKAINMTREHGAGTLLHEFMHALDHIIGEIYGERKAFSGGAQSLTGWREKPGEKTYLDNKFRLRAMPENVRRIVNELMDALFWRPENLGETITRIQTQIKMQRESIARYARYIKEEEAKVAKGEAAPSLRYYTQTHNEYVGQLKKFMGMLKEPEKYSQRVETDYYKEAKRMDGLGSKDYYKRPNEMFARAGEAWGFDKLKSMGRQNDYLVHGVEGWRFRGTNVKGNPYLQGEERDAAKLLFDELFAALRSAKGTKEYSKIEFTKYKRDNTDNVYTVLEHAKGSEARNAMIEKAIREAGEAPEIIKNNLSDAFADHLSREAFGNILAARRFASERGYDIDIKKVEEELELGVVKRGRDIVAVRNGDAKNTYADLIELLGRQPKLTTRTSTSIRDQAYSTPIPLAYLVSRLAKISDKSEVYEPTAGNGALLIEANPLNTVANEINEDRVHALEEMNFTATSTDVARFDNEEVDDRSMDVVVANPPFGTIKTHDDKTRSFDMTEYLDNYYPTNIDHVIALKSLKKMKLDGRAVIVVGSINPKNTEKQDRFTAYQGEGKRLFYKALFDNYNVIDHFTVAGDLYQKQGAGWPVDVIVIDGVGKSALPLPAVNLPVVLRSWEQMTGLLDDQNSRGLPEEGRGGIGPSTGRGSTRGNGQGGKGTSTGGGGRLPRPSPDDQPVDLQPESDGTPGGEPADTESPEGRPPTGKPGTRKSDGDTDAVHGGDGSAGVKLSDAEVDNIVDDIFANLFDDEPPSTKASSTEEGGPAPAAPAFNEDAYQRLLPGILATATRFPALYRNVPALAKAIAKHMQVTRNWTKDDGKAEKFIPYLKRFMRDVNSKIVQLEAPEESAAIAAEPEEHQVDWTPIAEANYSLKVKANKNLIDAQIRGIRKVEAIVGPMTDYAATKTGLSKPLLMEVVGAEQIEAIGLAEYNLSIGSAFINGAQAGIGKGRTAAIELQAIHRRGQVPVFCTDSSSLFRDIYRDLIDTKFVEYIEKTFNRKPRILMTNAGESIDLDDEDPSAKLPKRLARDIAAELNGFKDAAEVLAKYDLVFTSYGQLQMTGSGEPDRRAFLRMLAGDAVIVFDESHNAAGEAEVLRNRSRSPDAPPPPPNRAGFARELVRGADGIYYMSATYAKNPNAMVFYSRTNMRHTVDDVTQLPALFAFGGVPLQQIVAIGLAEDGQYLRFERDLKGIDYLPDKMPVNRENYDGVCTSFSEINALANFIKELVRNPDSDIGGTVAGGGGAFGGDNAVGDVSVTAIGFTSILHNAVSQLLLAMKAKHAAKLAIEAIQRGEKPILGLYNTLEGFLKQYMAAENAKRTEDYENKLAQYNDGLTSEEPKPLELMDVGSEIPATFNDILHRYLERARTVRIKDENGNKTTVRLTDAQLTPKGVQLYSAAKSLIDSLDLAGLPISPLDAIINDIQKAGYKIGEITGRELGVDYSGPVPKVRRRSGKERGQAGKIGTVRAYNNLPDYAGDDKKKKGIHAVVMNAAGSTGVSMHAHEDFADRSKRHMILLQAPPDINIFFQMLGRINRTKQVELPIYTQVFADIPAETRPGGLLLKKMASLNANTTGARGGAWSTKVIPDFFNRYGDEVAAEYLINHPAINAMMDRPLRFNDGQPVIQDVMHRLTGKLTLVVPTEKQDEIYDLLTREYLSLVQQREAMGENILESKILPLDARPLNETEVVPAIPGIDSVFAAPVTIFQTKVKRIFKPMSTNQIAEAVEKTTGRTGLVGKTLQETADNLEMLENTATNSEMEHIAKQEAIAQEKLAEFDPWWRETLAEIEDNDEREALRGKLDEDKRRWSTLHNTLVPGSRWSLVMPNEETIVGILLHVEHKGKAPNPLAMNAWSGVFATAESSRQLAVPFSRLYPTIGNNATAPSSAFNAIDLRPRQTGSYADTLNYFASLEHAKTEKRYIATGNILAAYAWLNGSGRITQYTTYNGKIEQGILCPADFNLKRHATVKGDPIKNGQELKDWLDAQRGRSNTTPDAVIQIKKTDAGYEINIKRDAKGKVYSQSAELIRIIGRDFMTAPITGATGRQVTVMQAIVNDGFRLVRGIDKMKAMGADFRIQKNELDIKTVDTSDVPDLEALEEERIAAEKEAKKAAEDAEKAAKDTKPPEGPPTAGSTAIMPLTPPAQKRWRDIQRVIRKEVNYLVGPGRVSLQFLDVVPRGVIGWGQPTEGGRTVADYDTLTNAIRLSINIDDPLWMASNAFHESYHAVQNLLQTDKERAMMARELPTMRRYLKARKDVKQTIPTKYFDTMVDYEVEANAFQSWMTARLRNKIGGDGLHVGVRRTFDRLFRFARGVKNGLSGLGFQTFEDVFERVASGEMAKRPVRTDKPLMARVMAESDIEDDRDHAAMVDDMMAPDDFFGTNVEEPVYAASNTRASSAAEYAGRVYEKIEELLPDDWKTRFGFAFSDYSIRERNLQRVVEARFLGVPLEDIGRWNVRMSKLPDALQFYVNKELMSGRMAHWYTQFQKQHIKPFVRTAENAQITFAQIGDYLRAKGAEQRNAMIARAYREKQNHDFYKAYFDPDVQGGSAMSANEAEDIINQYETGVKGDDFKDLWARHQAMVEFELNMRVRTGLISQEYADELRENGDAYVSYRGWEEAPEDAPDGYYGGAGPMGVRGREWRQATGRRSKSEHPLVNLWEQIYRSIDRGEKNIHYNSLAAAFKEMQRLEMPIADLVKFDKGTPKKIIDTETGLVKEIIDHTEKHSKYAVWYKRNGIPHVMIFKDAKLAESIKMSRPWQLWWGFSHMLRFTNWMKSLWTHYSPDFAVRHFAFRYLIEGVVNLNRLKDTGKIDRLKWLADAVPSLGRAVRAIYAAQNGGTTHTDPKIQKLMEYYHEMSSAGGEMAFRSMRDTDPDRMKLELKHALKDLTRKPGHKQVRKWIHDFSAYTDKVFNVWDNATRLATFAQARDQGQSVQKAAYAAINATINYRKRGAAASAIGIPAPFMNTAIRTGDIFLEGLIHSKGIRQATVAVAMTGATLASWNYLAGGVDENGKAYFEKMGHQTELNMVIMNPFIRDAKGHPQTYMAPMPFNYAAPMVAGYQLVGYALSVTGMIKSDITVGQRLAHVAKAALMTFTTVVEGGNALDNIIVEPLKPFVHNYINKNWLGHPVHIEPDKQRRLKTSDAYSGKMDIGGKVRTGEGWKVVAQTLNDWTGGSRTKNGWIHWYPEDIKEVVYQPFGAQIRLVNELRHVAEAVSKGEVPTAAKSPLFKVFGNPDWEQIELGERLDRVQKAKEPWKR